MFLAGFELAVAASEWLQTHSVTMQLLELNWIELD